MGHPFPPFRRTRILLPVKPFQYVSDTICHGRTSRLNIHCSVDPVVLHAIGEPAWGVISSAIADRKKQGGRAGTIDAGFPNPAHDRETHAVHGDHVADLPKGGADVVDITERFEVSYEKCMETLGGAARPKTLSRPLEWIHIPKCGTSFGAVLHGYLCQMNDAPYENPNAPIQPGQHAVCDYCGDRKGEGKHLGGGSWWDPKLRNLIPFSNKFWKKHRHRWHEYYAPYCDWTQTPNPPYSNHFPLSPKPTKNDVMVLLREPRKRLVSSWNNNKHSYGATGPEREEINACQTLKDFVHQKVIPGCQTKMLLGSNCASKQEINERNYGFAEKRLRDELQFVGLTDAFNASVCLFHHQFGGLPLPYMFQSVGRERSSDFLFKEYKNTKKYKPLPGGGDRVPSAAWAQLSPDDDPFDSRLYNAGKSLFIERLKQYNLYDIFLPSQ